MSDEMHKLFNEAHSAATALAEALQRHGYEDMSSTVERFAVTMIDATHHDYTELILDPS